MPESLAEALASVRELLLSPELTRAVAGGRRRGHTPSFVRAELRRVMLREGTRLQVVTSNSDRPHTRNLTPGPDAAKAVDALLAEPFGTWRVESAGQVLQLRVTKKGEAQVHRTTEEPKDSPAPSQHDRVREHLLDPGDPLFAAIGGTAAKRRQVDAFLRALVATLGDAAERKDAADEARAPLRVVDLGCGNAYLTFAAYRYLSGRRADIEVVGVDVRADQRRRNSELADRLGVADRVRFVAGAIRDTEPFADGVPDVVLALHACDTATDEALARAVRWGVRWVLAAPCCHHDIAAQLRRRPTPEPYAEMIRHGILRERFADTLTDTLRAYLMRLHGYAVDVVEFIDSTHTPRNTLLRARSGAQAPTDRQRDRYAALVEQWGVTPALETLLRSR